MTKITYHHKLFWISLIVTVVALTLNVFTLVVLKQYYTKINVEHEPVKTATKVDDRPTEPPVEKQTDPPTTNDQSTTTNTNTGANQQPPAPAPVQPPATGGRLYAYCVFSHGNVGSLDDFRAIAAATLSNPQGWIRAGVTFKEVTSGCNFKLILSEAQYVPGYAPGVCDTPGWQQRRD
ncbi:hypothetical protein FWF48_03490 [Candidatus Saccharibacteria bacterium]|nr:hypothetical protein [Candidatus Saccharibacteria bacterium]